MTARILDGRALAREIRAELAERCSALAARTGAPPRLAIIRVGEGDQAAAYVSSLARAAEAVGIEPMVVTTSLEVDEEEVGERIDALGRDPRVAGIVLAEPLPEPLSSAELAARVDPRKDVDGVNPLNAGRLARGEAGMVPATALAVMTILRRHEVPIAGARAVVVGRSPVIGRPAALMLTAADATVVICHSRTRDIGAETRRAEILVVAAGRPGLIGPQMVSHGCTVIDCGITATSAGIVGDVDFEAVLPIVAAITPVPGGVGPVTATMVASQTIDAAERMAGQAS